MVTADALDVVLRVQNLRAFQTQMRSAQRSVEGVGAATKKSNAAQQRQAGVMGMVRKASIGMGVAMGVAAFEGYKMSVNFEKEMLLVHTQAGASIGEVKKLSDEVLNMASASQFGPLELAKGLYHIESLGFRGAEAMKALAAATQGATVGQADLEQTAGALGSAFFVGIKGATDLHGTMATLNSIVGAGNMRMDDLTHALGTGILAASKVAGVSLQSVGAAIALLSDDGTNAASGSAQLATALHFLYAPTEKAKTALGKLGLNAGDFVDALSGPNGLHAALKLLKDKLDTLPTSAKRLEALGNILPAGRGRVLLQLMEQLDKLDQKYDQIGHTAGNFDKAYSRTQQTSAFKLKKAWSSVQVELIKLGDALKGTFTPALVILLHILAGVIIAFRMFIGFLTVLGNIWKATPGPIKAVIVILGLMVAQMLAAYVAVKIFWAIRTAILAIRYAILIVRGALILLTLGSGPLVLAIMLVIAVLILMVTHWKQVKHAASDVWHWIKGHWKLLAVILTGPIGLAAVFIIGHFRKIKKFIGGVIHWIKDKLHDVLGLASKVTHPLGIAGKALGFVGGLVGGAGGLNVGSQGGSFIVGEHGRERVTLPGGSSVVPLATNSLRAPRVHAPSAAPAGGPEGDVVVHSHLYLDSKEIFSGVQKVQADRRARR